MRYKAVSTRRKRSTVQSKIIVHPTSFRALDEELACLLGEIDQGTGPARRIRQQTDRGNYGYVLRDRKPMFLEPVRWSGEIMSVASIT
jgi:hypothetical protein